MKTAEDLFSCRQCGDCCTGFGGTYVTPKDVVDISRFIKEDPASFAKKFCEKSGSRLVLATGQDNRCIFFDALRQCTIHPVKPYMCRAWPFIRVLLKHPENWSAMANSCPGMAKDARPEDIQRITKNELKALDASLKE